MISINDYKLVIDWWENLRPVRERTLFWGWGLFLRWNPLKSLLTKGYSSLSMAEKYNSVSFIWQNWAIQCLEKNMKIWKI